ncbi:hypothetical protein J2X45_003397 [Caulobacter sp. BE264]|uniref:head-tail joining protein n=1 Tax=Caulobacter sp. BE264 TaxID=2817724 RepID=UPI0028593D19|nr:hypothetical protein [Caulobacter sp. BE264]MDR7232291.1 hypothetical protein [Caulobacter sp. BE264]
MSWSENLAAMNADVFAELADGLATWPGLANPVPVIIRGEDATLEMGGAEAIAAATFLEVRVADVANPTKGQEVQLGSVTYKVLGKPRRGEDFSVWICEVAKL